MRRAATTALGAAHMTPEQKRALFDAALAKFQDAKARLDAITLWSALSRWIPPFVMDRLYEAQEESDKARREFDEACKKIEDDIPRRKI
jgi:proline dehydrogenase